MGKYCVYFSTSSHTVNTIEACVCHKRRSKKKNTQPVKFFKWRIDYILNVCLPVT